MIRRALTALLLAAVAVLGLGASYASAGTHHPASSHPVPVTSPSPGIGTPAAHSPLNNLGVWDEGVFNSSNNGFYLHAHSLTGAITICGSTCGGQDWLATSLGNGYYQEQLSGSTWCAEWNSLDGGFYLENCSGQAPQAFTLFADGSGAYWWVNLACTNADGFYGYMTANTFTNNSIVNCEGQGQGDRAVWQYNNS